MQPNQVFHSNKKKKVSMDKIIVSKGIKKGPRPKNSSHQFCMDCEEITLWCTKLKVLSKIDQKYHRIATDMK